MTTQRQTQTAATPAPPSQASARGCRVDLVHLSGDSVLERYCEHHLHRARERSRTSEATADLLAVVRAVVTDCVAAAAPPQSAPGSSGAGDPLDDSRRGSLEAELDIELRVVEAVERAKAVLDAHALTALARMSASADALVAAAPAAARAVPVAADELVTMEVTAATGLGQREVCVRLELATGSEQRFGRLRRMLHRGAISLRRACEVVQETRHLIDDDVVDDLVEAVFAPTRDEAGLSGALFRQRLRRAILRADEDAAAAAARRREARRRNGAQAQVFDDGTGQLTVRNDADKIAAAMDRADAAARAAKAAGDPRSLDQLRADFLTGAAIYGQPGPSECTDPRCERCRGGAQGSDKNDPAQEAAQDGRPDEAAQDGRPDEPAQDGPPDEPVQDGEAVPDGHTEGAQGSHSSDVAAHCCRSDQSEEPDASPDARLEGATTSGAHPCGATPEWFASFGTRPPGRVWIVVPVTTALGLDDAPCRLPGHGWVSAEQARSIITAEGSAWQALLADVDTGRALRLSRKGYRPSARMIDHITAVDGTCRGPGCTVPATQCDLDHDIPYPEGPTDVDHLSSKHRQHHRVRTAGFWQAVRDPDDATVAWRTGAGRRYVTYPTDWLEDVRPRPRVTVDHNPEPITRPFGPRPDPDRTADPAPPPF